MPVFQPCRQCLLPKPLFPLTVGLVLFALSPAVIAIRAQGRAGLHRLHRYNQGAIVEARVTLAVGRQMARDNRFTPAVLFSRRAPDTYRLRDFETCYRSAKGSSGNQSLQSKVSHGLMIREGSSSPTGSAELVLILSSSSSGIRMELGSSLPHICACSLTAA